MSINIQFNLSMKDILWDLQEEFELKFCFS